MTRDSKIARAICRSLWTSAVAIAATSIPAYAQDQNEAPQTVVVTGSRIARPELESTTPILALSEQDMDSRGLVNVADISAQLPQFAPSFGSSRTQSTFSGAASSGLNQFNLRNLGSQRTLTLINGRRAPGGRTTSTGVDFNLIPTANLERIELLTGGASAVYGSDAVSGVVNLITKKKFTGIEFGANYTETADHDNKSPGGYLLLGGNFGETGHGLLTVEYQKQGEVSCRDRYLCAQDFAWTDPTLPPLRGPAAYSGVAPVAKFQAGTTGPFYTARNGGYTDSSGALIPFATAVDGYNRNADRTLAIPTKRFMIAAEGDVELPWAGIKGFAELNYGESKTDAPFEGHPFQSSQPGSLFGGGPGLTGLQASVPISNPFIPTALRNRALANGVNPATGVLNWQQRFNVFDSRGAINTREMYRGVAGLRGELESIGGFGSEWSWEISHMYGSTKLNSITRGLVATDRLYYGLRVEQNPAAPAGTYRCVDPGARASGCVPINPFAPYSQAVKDYLGVTAGQSGRSDLEDTTAFLSGSLFNLPAGSLKAVLGVERRSFAGFLDYDEQINRALVTGNQIGDVSRVKIETKEIFTEIDVPVLKDLPFARSVDVTGSFRRSKPNSGDNYNTWGYGLNWQPIEGLRVRASKARAVRTPVPDDLSGVGQTFGVVNDPCTAARRNNNATRAANCASDGVPTNYAPPLTVEQSVAGFVGGNPNLAPEVGDTLTFGFVWQPSFVPGFNLSVDRFRIDVADVINTVGRQIKADLCYDSTDRLFCTDLQRGVNPNTPGNWALLAVNDQLVNVASLKISGFDIEAGYKFALGTGDRYGNLSIRALMTIYDKADQTPLPGKATIDFLGYAGGSTSDQGWLKKQAVTDIRYALGSFAASWHVRYIGSAFMAPGAEEFGKVGSRFYHDVRFSYDVGEGSQLYLGVDNLADKDPPFFATGTSGTQALDTIPAYYDVFGRTYFGGVRVKF
jgi:outer membrane receptor protein involved in Fe transport